MVVQLPRRLVRPTPGGHARLCRQWSSLRSERSSAATRRAPKARAGCSSGSGSSTTIRRRATHRLRHWAYSLTRAHDSIGIAKLDVPWWTYGAIDEVERWLAGRDGDVRAFEWGSGASTIWLARRVAEVHSVEHHAEFGAMIQEQLAAWPNATLDIVEPVAERRTGDRLGQGGPRRARLHRLRRPHRHASAARSA